MKRRIPPMRWIVFLLLLTMLATSVSFAKYVTTVTGTGTVSVARPVVEFLNNSDVTITGMKPGETREYPFSVTNHTDEGQNQVTMEYALSVVAPNNWPISAVISRQNGEYNGEWVTMNHSSDEIHNYILRLTWDASATGSAVSTNMGQTWGLRIHLDAVQVD